MASRLMFVSLLSALTLGGCAYDDGYGYGGMSAGAGYYAGDYYGPAGYGGPGYGGYGGGWYNDFYYPGTGYYVFDRGGRRHRWNDGQRSYWEARRQQYRARDQARRPDGNRNGDYRRWRDGRNQDRRVDRGPDGRGQRGDEGRRGWRADRQVNGAAPGAITRPDRPAFRDRGRVEGNAGAPRIERRDAAPRSNGGPSRSRGVERRTQQP